MCYSNNATSIERDLQIYTCIHMYTPNFLGDMVVVFSVAGLPQHADKLHVMSYDYQLKVLLIAPVPVTYRYIHVAIITQTNSSASYCCLLAVATSSQHFT